MTRNHAIVAGVIVAVVLSSLAFLGHGLFSRRLTNWYVQSLGGDIFEPVCTLYGYRGSPEVEPMPSVRVSIPARYPPLPILTACRAYDRCVVYIEANELVINDEIVNAMVKIRRLGGIGMRNCSLTDTKLARIGAFARLESACVDGNPIDASGFVHWRSPETLQYLSAQSTNIDDSTVSNLLLLNNLKYLNLSFTEISDESCRALAQLPRLELLSIDGTAVGDEGLMHLTLSRTLSCVFVIDTNVTLQGIKQFELLRPDVRVISVDLDITAPQAAGADLPAGEALAGATKDCD